MEHTRVTRIQVVKLFDEINYDIHLDETEPVGIIIAPNGCGKTTILKLLAFVLKPTYERYLEIRDIPFSRFVCYLSNGKRIVLKSYPTTVARFDNDEDENEYIYNHGHPRSRSAIANTVNDFEYSILPSTKSGNHGLRFSEILDSEKEYRVPLEYSSESESLTLRERSGRIAGMAPIVATTKFEETLKSYLVENTCNKPVVFISTSRLQAERQFTRNELAHLGTDTMADPLFRAAKRIASIVRRARENYNMEVSKAKDRLPCLFLQNDSVFLPLGVFLKRWRAYTDELEKFQKIGLIEHCEEFINEGEIPNVYEAKKEFLNTYLFAFQYTVKPLNEVYEKLSLFKKIFDERNSITHKTVNYGPDGIELYSRDKKLDLSYLSSGEKHDFIMFFNLIFIADKDSMILVDEPEISLHIEWQESYLDHLIEICKMNQMQAIVATHSPNIVSTHYDSLLDMGEHNADS